ncbi:MAG: M36 family metallopeptidase [Nitrospira sp.]|nr:M36 family metallopeptidase [Nitrospira sp.]
MKHTVKPSWRLTRRGFKQVKGDHYGTPKEVWGFRTKATHSSPCAIARDFLLANADLFQITQDVGGLVIQRMIRSLGATHVILKQMHKGHRIHRGYLSVHIDRSGRVFLAKNRAVPAHLLPDTFKSTLTREDAVRQARRYLPKKERLATQRETELVWFPRSVDLIPAWKVRLTREAPREEWLVYLNARTGAKLSQYNNLAEASTGRGLVFDPNPVTSLGDHQLLIAPNKRVRQPPPVAYREVALPGLDTSGTLSGEKVTTEGTRARVRSASGTFLLRSHQRGFEEVMVYYHIDAALRYLEALGYRGRRAIFRTPVRANATGTRDDNSWYSPVDRSLTFGTGAIDDAEDAETILHELGHAIQDAICPDFGQSAQAAAMGEGFGDYFAASFFESRKPASYRQTVMSWDGLLLGLGARSDPPSLRRLDDIRSFKKFDEAGDEHDNGTIWSAALWEIRKALGRKVADTLIIESHFQLDGFTTFARGARAIIDADKNLYGGKHHTVLVRIFRRRKVGPL